jgi:hypothetical protein
MSPLDATLRTELAPLGYAVDTSLKCTSDRLARLKVARYEDQTILGIGRYVSLGQPQSEDVDRAELDAITGEGFGSWFIQRIRDRPWAPSLHLGQIDGAWAARNALIAGYQPGTHGGIDLENVALESSLLSIRDYIAGRAEAYMDVGGFPSVLYVGFDSILTPLQLWQIPSVHLYWKDWGPRTVDKRGFAVVQLAGDIELNGVLVDLDEIRADELGGRLEWTVAAS